MGDDKELRSISQRLSYLTEMVESELLTKILTIQQDIFAGSAEQRLVIVLLTAREPLPLSRIALGCEVSDYAVRPGGSLRKILETMESDRLIVNTGTAGKPRYALNKEDETVRFLIKVFAPLAASHRRAQRPSNVIFS